MRRGLRVCSGKALWSFLDLSFVMHVPTPSGCEGGAQARLPPLGRVGHAALGTLVPIGGANMPRGFLKRHKLLPPSLDFHGGELP